jgi:hypothetical protein
MQNVQPQNYQKVVLLTMAEDHKKIRETSTIILLQYFIAKIIVVWDGIPYLSNFIFHNEMSNTPRPFQEKRKIVIWPVVYCPSSTYQSCWGVKSTTHLHLLSRILMSEAITPIPLYAFKACKGTN